MLVMKVKMTAKRQATFPAELCRELGLKPGDTLDLESHFEEGRKFWTLRRSGETERPWLGALRSYAAAVPAETAPPSVSFRPTGSGLLRARWGAGV